MRNIKIGIIKYGIGNLQSIKNSLLTLGYRVSASANSYDLDSSDVILLPGVGAFKPAMKSIKDQELDNFITDWFFMNKPIVGICLGMQLLAASSNENGYMKGLGLIPGNVSRIENNKTHIGWSNTKLLKNNPYFSKQDAEQDYYFNHSYAYPVDENYTVLASQYLGNEFSAVVAQKKLIGFQFHPEKSQFFGRKVLKNSIDHLCYA